MSEFSFDYMVTNSGVQESLAPVINSRTFEDLLTNAIMSRSQLMDKLLDPRRDIDAECGFPKTGAISIRDYRRMFDRDPIANRMIGLYPSETWLDSPHVWETDDPNDVTPFEEAWDQLSLSIDGDSWYQDDEESAVWTHLYNLDLLSGVGRYGVMLFGFDDIDDANGFMEPIAEVESGKPGNPRKLLYLREFDEVQAEIAQVETSRASARYGLPTRYRITLYDPMETEQGLLNAHSETIEVHWTRCLHFARGTRRQVISAPLLRPVLNRLLDLRKLYGGSAEMYWKGAFPGISIETNPQLGANVKIDQTFMRNQMEQYMNGLQRYLSLSGMQAKTLSPTVVDPTSQIKAHLEAIAIQADCPMRIFMGSERGELASSQDKSAWTQKIKGRRQRIAVPSLIAPFVDMLILTGVLPEPETYKAGWDYEPGLSEQEKASTALTRTQALVAYIGGGVDALIPPTTYLTRELGYSDEEAQSVLESANESQADAANGQSATVSPDVASGNDGGDTSDVGTGPEIDLGADQPTGNIDHVEEDEFGTWEMIPNNYAKRVMAINGNRELNNPFRTPDGPKKFAVYTKNGDGNVVLVRFGDPEMEIKRDDPERRKNFRARHGCDIDAGPKWKPKYWSCKFWSETPVDELV